MSDRHRFIFDAPRRVFMCVRCGHLEPPRAVLDMAPTDARSDAWEFTDAHHADRLSRVGCQPEPGL